MSRFPLPTAVIALCLMASARAEMTCGIDHVVIDGVKIPYGTVVEVVGPWHPYRYGKHHSPGVKAHRINGRANDDDITVELVAAENGKLRRSGGGSYFKIRGPIMDAYDGHNKKFNVIVEQLEAVEPPTLADSVNRTTALKGVATAGSRLSVGLGPEQALLDGLAAWPAGVEGKWVAVSGTLRGEQGAWRIENPQWQFLQLADRIGQAVVLEGEFKDGWFEYRNEKLYLTNAKGRVMESASEDRHRRARVTGRLIRQDRPSLEHAGYKSIAPLVPNFVIRGAEIEFLEPPLEPERFLYRQPIRIEDGVPVLVAEDYPSGLVGYETNALFYSVRNREVIEYIVRNATPQACDVMARRMADNELVSPLRLLYATILACLNDDRGRDYLVRNLEEKRSDSFLEALYCMGMFEWLRREKLVENAAPTELAWAEKPLISVMLDQEQIACKHPFLRSLDSQQAVADAAAYYSKIPAVLAAMNSAAAQDALLTYLAENRPTRSPPNDDDEESPRTFHEHRVDEVVRAICWRDELLPVDFLLRLEPHTAGCGTRGEVLVQLLRHKHPAAAERFLLDLEGEYYEFVRYLSREFAAALRPHISKLEGGAKACATMLDVLSCEDPVPELLRMLADDSWPLKRVVVEHLAQIGDPRAVTHIADILRNAPSDYFRRFDSKYQGWNIGDPVPSALYAIEKPGTDQSIRELIGLLDVDLSRFGGWYKRDDYQRIVAARLIDLTGESFGVDAEKWQAWLNSRDSVEKN